MMSACGAPQAVPRFRGEITSVGRHIPPSAYAYYMGAVRDESHGNIERAEQLYLRTIQADPRSGSAWAGLVRTGCRTSQEHVEDLANTAKKVADRPALALVALANCLLEPAFKTGQDQAVRLKAAQQAAEEALTAEPQLLPASLALKRALNLMGSVEQAARICPAYELYTNRPCQSGKTADASSDPLSSVDALLLKGRLTQGIDAAAGLMTPGELSIRLLALGLSAQALEQAQFVLINDPDDLNAQLVLCLTERPLTAQKINAITAQVSDDGAMLAPLGRVLLLIELARTEKQAASLLLKSDGFAINSEQDQLLVWWRGRLETTLR